MENEETAPKSKYLHNKYGFDCDNNGEKDDNDSTDANYDNCVSDMDEECDSGMQDVSPWSRASVMFSRSFVNGVREFG